MAEHSTDNRETLGSIPIVGTKLYLAGVMAACQSPKLLVGVRVPGGMPNYGDIAQR